MRKLKIYLSGAITGRENYKEEFEYAKIRIKDFEAKNNKKTDKEKIKLDVIVPCHYDYLNKTGKWEDYLKNDIKMLELCKKKDVCITIGSDAHIEEDICNFGFAEELLEEVDFPDRLIVNKDIDLLNSYLHSYK